MDYRYVRRSRLLRFAKHPTNATSFTLRSASKAGVINLATTAASNLAGTNIRVVRPPSLSPPSPSHSLRTVSPAKPLPFAALAQNAICPGLIETGMTTYTFDRARERGTLGKVGQLNPLRRCVGSSLSPCPRSRPLWTRKGAFAKAETKRGTPER